MLVRSDTNLHVNVFQIISKHNGSGTMILCNLVSRIQ